MVLSQMIAGTYHLSKTNMSRVFSTPKREIIIFPETLFNEHNELLNDVVSTQDKSKKPSINRHLTPRQGYTTFCDPPQKITNKLSCPLHILFRKSLDVRNPRYSQKGIIRSHQSHLPRRLQDASQELQTQCLNLPRKALERIVRSRLVTFYTTGW